MNYLFWNTNEKPVNNVLKELISGLKCDIIGLAEYKDNIQELINGLWMEGFYLYEVPQIGCKRIQILTKYEVDSIIHFEEQSYYTVKKIPHDKYGFHIIAFLHLSSKLYGQSEDRLAQIMEVKSSIEKAEIDVGNTRSVIIGDFNMNPFEYPMVMAGGMHSLSCRQVVNERNRTVSGKKYSMFYNPMWNKLGDNDKPQGTYFYRSSIQTSYFWNTFDQVLIRPELIPDLNVDNIKIIDEINGISLKDDKGIPNISDHFPLYFELGGIE